MVDSKRTGLWQRARPSVTRMVVIGVVVVAAGSAAFSANAQNHHAVGMQSAGDGHGMTMFGGSPDHVRNGIDHLLEGVNATVAQRSQIQQIAMSVAAELQAGRQARRGLHDKALQIFAAPSLDAAAAEAVRQQLLAGHDQVSKRVMQAMLDVSNVLTPEQRAKIAERVRQRQATKTERLRRESPEQPKQ